VEQWRRQLASGDHRADAACAHADPFGEGRPVQQPLGVAAQQGRQAGGNGID
jgi:hypothetical protein